MIIDITTIAIITFSGTLTLEAKFASTFKVPVILDNRNERVLIELLTYSAGGMRMAAGNVLKASMADETNVIKQLLICIAHTYFRG